ncbi:hypothetical protein [Microbacterium oleivorans]|uniref:hypothetical protein n=1 Tax=Microbacterium TaxID=33882 RepID=UPI0020419B53|nr:hypothetical protein [Microbacterium oleivorans]MCM3695234.1 hypothetical protein [Microbacterium oleivorans]
MNIAGVDLGSAILFALLGAGIAAAVTGLLIWDARRRKSPSVLLDVIAALARIWVAWVILAILTTVLRWSTTDTFSFSDLPLWANWPTALPCDMTSETGGGMVIDCAHFTSGSVTVVGIEAGYRLLLAVGEILTLLVSAVPGLVIAVISERAVRGHAFARRASVWMMAGAVTVLVAGTLGPVLSSLAQQYIARAVLPADSATLGASPFISIDAPLWPLGIALALLALSVIFRQGARLQRETEGLV